MSRQNVEAVFPGEINFSTSFPKPWALFPTSLKSAPPVNCQSRSSDSEDEC
jgi:hypothetical protein